MTTNRKEIADALKLASAMMFFKYRYAMVMELGVMPWGKRRVDLIGNKISGDIVIVEIKSSLADFRVDVKWTEYLPFADRTFLAFTKDVWNKIKKKKELADRIPKSVGVLILGDDGYMHSVKRATRQEVSVPNRITTLARLAWRNGDLSKRTQRQRKRVYIKKRKTK